jgi:acetyl-CoA acyltransferase
MSHAFIIDALRTPLGRGKPGGMHATVHPVDLLAEAITALVSRSEVDPTAIDDVIAGCVSQTGEQSMNIARNAVLAAGLPESVPATTVDRQCGSSQQALHFAAQGIMAGSYDLALAVGVEAMSRVPMGSSIAGQDPYGPRLTARYPGGLIPQGISAELIAQKWGITRQDADEYSAASHAKAAVATDKGWFDDEVAPVERDSLALVTRDEGIRPETTADRLAELRPAFQDPFWDDRFPGLPWVTTAGNASQITDGSAALLVASEDAVADHQLTPRARVVAMAVAGDDPLFMLTAVIPATRGVLHRAGLTIDDIDVFEVNEAFAPVVLAWERELGADLDRVNVHGGAIALGHPLGASGARLTATMLGALERTDGRYGLQVMCEGGGQANAMIVERLA